MKPPKVVFDTNILFSAVGWTGALHACVEAARQNKCVSPTAEEILTEFSDKLGSKRGFDPANALAYADEVRAFSILLNIPKTLRIVTADPDDDAVLECAVIGKADYLISGDRHLLGLGGYQNVRILRASEFLSLLSMR